MNKVGSAFKTVVFCFFIALALLAAVVKEEDQRFKAVLSQCGLLGQCANIKTVSALVSPLSGATGTATNLIPAGAFVVGVTTRVTTLVTASAGTGFTIGDGTVADRWGSAVALSAGTTTSGANFKAATAPYQAYPTATSVVLTMTGGNFTAGAVRVTVHYIDFTPATS